MTVQELNLKLKNKLNDINSELLTTKSKLHRDPSYTTLLSKRMEELQQDKSLNEALIYIISKMKVEEGTEIASLVNA